MTTILVYANKEYNLVDSDLSPGDTLQFEVEPGQVWKDACIACDEKGHGHDSVIWQSISHMFARLRGAPLFALTACVCECGKTPTDDCLVNVGSGLAYVVGGDPAKKYCVYLFANDVSLFYWNNSGAIDVRVTRRS